VRSGDRFQRGGTDVIKVDGKQVATQKREHTLPFILEWDENLDVGPDTGTLMRRAPSSSVQRTPTLFTGPPRFAGAAPTPGAPTPTVERRATPA
jgi:hypothetical protein